MYVSSVIKRMLQKRHEKVPAKVNIMSLVLFLSVKVPYSTKSQPFPTANQSNYGVIRR